MTKIKKSKKRFFVECQTTVNIVLGICSIPSVPRAVYFCKLQPALELLHSDEPVSLSPTDLKET